MVGAPHGTGRIGIIDIGSNSIRLVAYRRSARALQALFNERVLCGLGRDLEVTGRLNEAGVRDALASLARAGALAKAMQLDRLDAFATAAVRDARDGGAFIGEVERRCGFPVQVLSGEEEARFSALGVLSAIPAADGLVGDLGGGSLELVAVGDGATGLQATLPLGPFRLMRADGFDDATARIDRQLDTVRWLGDVKGRNFYPVGGAWRDLARIEMARANHPVRVIHQYALDRAHATDIAFLVAHMSRKSLLRLGGTSRRRAETLPLAALVFARLLRRVAPGRIVFSAYGVREGIMFERLDRIARTEDPLIEGCIDMGRAGRLPVDGEGLAVWMAPLFQNPSPEDARLRRAAGWLADFVGAAHPDHRGEQAFRGALNMPVVGIDHPGRAFVALALMARYEGSIDAPVTESIRTLLTSERRRAALVTGLALRLAFAICAGVPAVLARTRLANEAGTLRLFLDSRDARLDGEVVRRRLASLAGELQLKDEVVAGA
ncbi:MAG: Ppx/GppA family phosphatase [Alphaproteobacteria bacterium]|nr:Ppx/GppA family phosphatase [Alphaproteobacteria bacterium]